jgi:hypothetical protein
MSLLQQVLKTQSMYSFYQDLLRKSAQQQNAHVYNPPQSMKTVLSLQTLAELQRKKSYTPMLQQKIYITTQELIMPGVIDEYKKKGLFYIRRRTLSFRDSLRNPTIGCHIELLKYQEPCSYHIDSQKAKKILYRLCF